VILRVWLGVPGEVARELDALIARHWNPASCVSDNGPELTTKAILKWKQSHVVAWDYMEPGKLS